MKNNSLYKYIFIILIAGLLGLSSCEEDLVAPSLSISASETSVELDDPVEVTIAGYAGYYVLFTNLSSEISADDVLAGNENAFAGTVLTVTKGIKLMEVSYGEPGEYSVFVLATNEQDGNLQRAVSNEIKISVSE